MGYPSAALLRSIKTLYGYANTTVVGPDSHVSVKKKARDSHAAAGFGHHDLCQAVRGAVGTTP